MRPLVSSLFLAAVWCLPSQATAQELKKFEPPAIKSIRVGFQPYKQDEPTPYKVGLWAPVHVEVFGGSAGIAPDPNRPPHLILETTDSEDVGTQIFVPVAVEPDATRTFTGYIKTGHIGQFGSGRDIKVTLSVKGRDYPPREWDRSLTLDINAHLYLTIGSRIPDLYKAARNINKKPGEKDAFNDGRFDTEGRHVAFENDVDRLPDAWFGYNGVDVVFLSTENRRFLESLGLHPERLKALAQWVRRGGRLVIPVAAQNQDVVAELLDNKIAWQPPIPVIPPRSQGNAKLTVMRLNKVEDWGGVRGDAFQFSDPKDPQKKLPIPVAILDPGKVAPGDWEIQADTTDGQPLIARVRYGLGQITYLAFSLEDPRFFNWTGKDLFLQTMLRKLASKAPVDNNNPNFQNNRRPGVSTNPGDLSTELVAQLDNFDVTVVPFGAVAFFIVLYILVVGPLDFILLKYVFKRLEWTWITFPTVVLSVSIIAYFAAYALKGQDLKINKVDIVDFDLRTKDVDDEGKPRVHAYGQTFFTILSPRIQNYTIGLEPNPAFWGEKPGKVLSVDLMSWMGRPSSDFNGMGRSGSGSFFRKPYVFREDAAALDGVPIPVWTTKAFSASWEQTLATPPFKADLVYHQQLVKGKELKITGTLESQLGVDLVDVWVFYGNQCYPLPEGLKSVKLGGAPQTIAIAAQPSSEVRKWVTSEIEEGPQEARSTSYNPTHTIKRLLFLEAIDIQGLTHNHLLRTIDLGWRLEEEPPEARDRKTREAILFGRVPFASGTAESVTTRQALPTNLWLGDTPTGEPGKTRPTLVGQLNQDTYVRVILPVRAAND